jgi:hypothetical protein
MEIMKRMGERPNPNQLYLNAIGARDSIEKTANYINTELYNKNIISREQQHEILWGLRIAFLALNNIIGNTEVFIDSGHYGTRKPIDF